MDELPSSQDLADAITDLGRIVARQGASLDKLVDDSRAAAARDRAGADIPLLVDLFTSYRDAIACAATARTARDRKAFGAIGADLERLITGRGGAVLVPAVGEPFDAATMDVAGIVESTGVGGEGDRTVDSVTEPGLLLRALGRSLRPARVVVRRVG